MGRPYSIPERRARDNEVPRVSRRERRLWRALSCCFRSNGARPYERIGRVDEVLGLEEPKPKEHGSLDHCQDLQRKLVEKEAEVKQSLEQHESEKKGLQTRITDLEGQIEVLQHQISDLEGTKNKLIAANKQELEKKEKEVQAALPPAEPDTEAKLKDLSKDLKEVQEWFDFGLNLDVAERKLQAIAATKHGDVDACRLQVLTEWGKLEKRTWQKVVRALLAVERTKLARELAKKYGVPLQPMASNSSERQHQAVKEMGADKEDLPESSLESQLKLVVDAKNNLEKELKSARHQSQLLNELYNVVQYERSQQQQDKTKAEEHVQLLKGLIEDKEEQIESLKDELEAKEKQITQLQQELEERKTELSQYHVLVHNNPHPENCTAFGIGLKLAETQQPTRFEVHLADIDGDPCVINHNVSAELKSIVDGSLVKVKVVSKSPSIYEVSYQPTIRGRHDLSVRVNGTPIQDSPFRVYVRQPPCLMNEPVRKPIDTEHLIEDIITTRSGDLVVYGNNKLSFYTRGGQESKLIKSIKLDFSSLPTVLRSSSKRIAVDSSDADSVHVYVVSRDTHHLCKFNCIETTVKREKTIIMKREQGQPPVGVGIVLSKDNKILFVCHSKRIQIYDTDLNSIGTHDNGEIKYPCDLAFDNDDNLYVADCKNGCIHVLEPQSGTYLRKIGTPGLHRPREMSVHVDHDWVYITHDDFDNVSVFTTTGESIDSFSFKRGTFNFDFDFAFAIAIDEDGFVYTACSYLQSTTRKRIDIF